MHSNHNDYMNMTVSELLAKGFFVFIKEPHVDFNPEPFGDGDGMQEGLSIAWDEGLSALDAEPIEVKITKHDSPITMSDIEEYDGGCMHTRAESV